MIAAETICAIATPPGVGGIGIVRVSGPQAAAIGQAICGRTFDRRALAHAVFRDASGAAIDSGLVLYFPAPRSFTGDDVLELQAHGSPVILGLLLRRVIELGARAARPGEFSERAFLNGRIDLMQAEALADLITSSTEAAARAARRSLDGAFSAAVEELQRRLEALRVFVEAAIDFPDEEIDFLADSDLQQRIDATLGDLRHLLTEARQGRLLRDGLEVVILGRPNAGKSSLLNALSGRDTAIVTAIPGTTRDLLREWIDLGGIPVHLTDTAGVRDTADPIEVEGVRRARRAVSEADLVLLLIDASAGLDAQLGLLTELPDPGRVLPVFSKMDLCPAMPLVQLPAGVPEPLAVSALTGEGIGGLKAAVIRHLGLADEAQGSFSARQRHVDALHRTARHLAAARRRLVEDRAIELLAEELRLAQHALGELTGETLPDDLLGAIFRSFCIGK